MIICVQLLKPGINFMHAFFRISRRLAKLLYQRNGASYRRLLHSTIETKWIVARLLQLNECLGALHI